MIISFELLRKKYICSILNVIFKAVKKKLAAGFGRGYFSIALS